MSHLVGIVTVTVVITLGWTAGVIAAQADQGRVIDNAHAVLAWRERPAVPGSRQPCTTA